MSSYCYLDGTIVAGEQARLPVTDLGLQRGYGVFDFMRTYNGRLFHPGDHLRRFRASASELSLHVPLSDERLLEIGNELLSRSSLDYPALKFILTGGDGTPEAPLAKPRLVIIAQNRPVFPDHLYQRGAHLLSVRFKRELPHVKTLNYLNSLRLNQWKRENGALDLLYHDSEHGVTESPQANLFMGVHEQNKLVTPPEGILKGITRQIVIELARPYYDVQIRPISYDEFSQCDECFICSTSKRIIPLTRVDTRNMGGGHTGQITRHLMQLFDEYTARYSTS